MTTVSTMVCIDYTPKQMYDLVNDVESYSEFLPLCTKATVLSRSQDSLKASVTLAKGRVKFSFTTLNTMEEGRRINMNLVDGPFKYLNGYWLFEPTVKGGCEASFKMDFEFSNSLLRVAFGGFFKDLVESLVGAFCSRADVIYGGHDSPQQTSSRTLSPATGRGPDVEG